MAHGNGGHSEHLPLVDHLRLLSLYEKSLSAVNEINTKLQNMIITGSPVRHTSLGGKISEAGKDGQGRGGEAANVKGLKGDKTSKKSERVRRISGGGKVSLHMFKTGQCSSKDYINHVLRDILAVNYCCYETVPGDGSCFFHAVIYQILRSAEIRGSLHGRAQHVEDSLTLREEVVDFIATDPNIRQNPVFDAAVRNLLPRDVRNLDEYLSKMRNPGYYVDDLAITMTAMYLGKDILLASDQNNMQHPFTHINVSGGDQHPIILAYIPGTRGGEVEEGHFEPIEPKHAEARPPSKRPHGQFVQSSNQNSSGITLRPQRGGCKSMDDQELRDKKGHRDAVSNRKKSLDSSARDRSLPRGETGSEDASSSEEDNLIRCIACNKPVRNIMMHLNRTKGPCKDSYDMEALKGELLKKKRAKSREKEKKKREKNREKTREKEKKKREKNREKEREKDALKKSRKRERKKEVLDQMSPEQREEVLKKERETTKARVSKHRSKKTEWFNATYNYDSTVDYASDKVVNIGKIGDVICKFCQGRKFKGETPGMCCSAGKVKVWLPQPPPPPLDKIFDGNTKESKNFLDNSRAVNGAFGMTSFKAKEVREGKWMPTFKVHGQVHHFGGPLEPAKGKPPQFLQLYFMGSSKAQAKRRGSFYGDHISLDLLLKWQELLHKINPYVRDFKYYMEIL